MGRPSRSTADESRFTPSLFSVSALAVVGALISGCGNKPPTGGSGGSGGSPQGVSVNVASGKLQGFVEGRTRHFLGIPYAEPPTAERRFAPPVPVKPWQGTRSATAFGPACIQQERPGNVIPLQGATSEDCLSLNVFAPTTTPSGGAPVMIFIHGGAGIEGSSSQFPVEGLSEAAGVVLVTLNYRLGPMADLSHPSIDAQLNVPSGNMGYRDQQLALRWVRENIAAFGGDPRNVTLFGESAGAVSACLQLFVSGSEGLVQRVILESGNCLPNASATLTSAGQAPGGAQQAQQLIDALCPSAADTLACLRTLPAQTLANWVPPGGIAALWARGPDGVFLKAPVTQLLREGRFEKVPVIIGSNENEWRLLELTGFPKVNTIFDYNLWVNILYGPAAPVVAEHYRPATDAQANAAWLRLQTDAWFRCPNRAFARSVQAHGVPVYVYSFEVSPGAHALELDYVFNIPDGGFISKLFPGEAPDPLTPSIVSAMQGYWGTFARGSDPNGAGRPAWPANSASSDEHIAFEEPITVGRELAKADCDFWDQLAVGWK